MSASKVRGSNRFIIGVAFAVVIGAILSAGVTTILSSGKDSTSEPKIANAKEPLYWVAPMDANFRRDEPGKSPMGMDLVPVFPDEGNDNGPGAVRISAAVQHNIGVRLAEVSTGPYAKTIAALGRVTVAEDQQSVVSPRIEGWLEKLYVKTTNQKVTKGEPLFEIYSPALVTAQEEFLAALKAGNAAMTRSARSRLRSLQVTDELLARVESTRKLERTVVFAAPQSGVVTRLDVHEGKFVTPGATVMQIAKLDQVWLVAEIAEIDAIGLLAGQALTAFFEGHAPIDAQIDFVYPILEAESRSLLVRAVLQNAEGQLKPNMFGEARIRLLDQSPTLLVPKDSLIRLGDQVRVVLALDGSSFKSIKIEIGRVGDQYAEVLSGLQQGDRVVTSAQFLIDSESSKSSDFRRMDLMPDVIFSGMHGAKRDADQGSRQALSGDNTELIWVDARVESILIDQNVVSITHEAIPEWNRPSMTMTMNTGSDIDLQAVLIGEDYEIQFRQDATSLTGFMIEQLVLPKARGNSP